MTEAVKSRTYAFVCKKCGRGTNSLCNDKCPWCANKAKKAERLERYRRKAARRNK